ncbi:hypothetical protein GH714_005488 [Hevea brasiliensis]|uniref:Ty3 transposon capsid-like protein domain-containing protein n=1 Tax=Hevea brasiliensis TaxID=3981 RepID=A0A6A6L624_HEVBR|nr:hypothetical protein GH714_005488 [Hevea brasiliensis]
MEEGRWFLRNWQNWSFQNTPVMIQLNGSQGWISSLNTREPQTQKRCLWPLITFGERQTNGGSGFAGLTTEAGTAVTWAIFSEELWSRFGPTDCEDFDESLSKIRQTGLLRDYQWEFERLGNRVKGWTQKALVGTFMGGLKPEIAEGIRMFKPKTLKEAISLARMRDEQLLRQKKAIRPSYQTSFLSPTTSKPSTPIKRLSWEEMQNRGRKDCALIVMRSLFLDTGTMRVVIQIKSLELICLIDSGSTHNFINEKGRITQIIGRTNQTLQRESSKWGSSSMQWKIQKYSSSLARYTLLNYVLFLANHGFGCGIRGTVAAAIGDSPMQLGQVDYGFYLEWGAATPARFNKQQIKSSSLKAMAKELTP